LLTSFSLFVSLVCSACPVCSTIILIFWLRLIYFVWMVGFVSFCFLFVFFSLFFLTLILRLGNSSNLTLNLRLGNSSNLVQYVSSSDICPIISYGRGQSHWQQFPPDCCSLPSTLILTLSSGVSDPFFKTTTETIIVKILLQCALQIDDNLLEHQVPNYTFQILLPLVSPDHTFGVYI